MITKEEYLEMKQKGQFNLPFFYDYYLDNIQKATSQTVRSFEEFSSAFPVWWSGPGSFIKEAVVHKCQTYFDHKFNIINVINPGDHENRSHPGSI